MCGYLSGGLACLMACDAMNHYILCVICQEKKWVTVSLLPLMDRSIDLLKKKIVFFYTAMDYIID
jgi:hypothetical protein